MKSDYDETDNTEMANSTNRQPRVREEEQTGGRGYRAHSVYIENGYIRRTRVVHSVCRSE